MTYFLSLDVGTTAVKAGVFDEEGRMHASVTREYALSTPAPNIVELSPEVYWEGFCEVAAEAIVKSAIPRGAIRSVGLCSQGETLIVLDEDGQPLRPAIVWIDNRSEAEADEIREHFGSSSNTGQVGVFATWPITKILWLRKHEPAVFQAAKRYLLVEDYLLYRLTGQFVGEYSLYTSSYMLDVASKRWWSELLEFVQVREAQLVSLTESGIVVGHLLPDVAARIGLTAGTLVVTGAMDQTAAMLGAGNITPGIVSETTGAALVVCSTLGQSFQPGSSMAIQYHAVPDYYLAIGWCPTGGMALKWLRDAFFSELPHSGKAPGDVYDSMVEMAATVSWGSQGLLFFPYLAGPGTLPIRPDARGAFWGLELHHGRQHFVRAVLEGVAFVLRQTLESLESLGARASEIRALGGGSKSRLWNQVKADVTGKPVRTLENPEAGLLGTALLQALALGCHPDFETAARAMVRCAAVIEPDPAGMKAYQGVWENFQAVSKRCFGI